MNLDSAPDTVRLAAPRGTVEGPLGSLAGQGIPQGEYFSQAEEEAKSFGRG